MRWKDKFSLRTVRGKMIMVSKAAGIILIVSYIVSDRLPVAADTSFLIWLALVILLVLAIDYLLGKFISAPISLLNRSARKMAQLDFSAACTVETEDEFGELSASLNKMAENLQRALEDLQSANMQLEKDVERERMLLAERKELADRLSHEMKTPLGVIRAYAEGLQDAADEAQKQKYAAVILEETVRLGDLITTLLDLSALESGASVPVPERFDFVEFLETVAGRLLIDTPDSNFVLQHELPEHRVYVYADKNRLEQVLNNLIVNAKRHVRPGGVLKLSLTERGSILHFSVYNQGNPVPEENLPKIWNKFYRDKKDPCGGSGLGLAIVAQILSMQDLPYGVENRPDGVRFYFSIPIEE